MSFGAIGGAVASSVIGGILGGGGGGSAAVASESQSNTQINPFDVTGGLFNTGFTSQTDEDGNVTNALNLGVGGALGDLQTQNISGAGQFNQLASGAAGGAAQGAAAAGQAGLGFLQQSQQDPFAMQQQLFQQQNQILAPLQEQQRLAQESRLFSQGRLGSQGTLSGSAQQQALFTAQGQQTQALLNSTFDQGQGVLRDASANANNLLQFQPDAAGLFGDLGNQQLGGVLDINQGALDTAQVAGTLSEQTTSSSTGALPQGDPSLLSTFGGGLLASGAEGVGNVLGGLFTNGGGPNPGIGNNSNPLFAGNQNPVSNAVGTPF